MNFDEIIINKEKTAPLASAAAAEKSTNKQIIIFKHNCANNNNNHNNIRIFCFDCPKICPVCNKELELNDGQNDDEYIEIKTLPNPLKAANKSRCSLAIRPTKGNFLCDYKNTSDLHICLTMSDGKIVEFNSNGINIIDNDDCNDDDGWQSCLIINIFSHNNNIDNINNNNSDYGEKLNENYRIWDEKLIEFIRNDERWTKSMYHSLNNNCFDFVLEFLRKFNQIKPILNDDIIRCKTKFCEHYIVPRTRLLARYISLYRKICTDGYVILGG